jgi:acylglycerol lipase
MQIQYDEGTFLATDRTEIYQQSWQPADVSAQAIIALVHGYGEHSGRYTRIATDLVRSGCAVYSFDLRGHGKSGGDLGYIESINDYLTDLDLFLTQLRQKSQNLGIFLLGHSLGGAIAIGYTIESKPTFQGLILSAPFLGQRDKDPPPSIVVNLVGSIGRLLPKLPTIKLDTSQLSRDVAIVRTYIEDPLVDRSKMPLRTLAEILANIQHIRARQREIYLPILIMHGTNDGIASVAHSEQLYTGISSADKSLKLYSGLYHEIFNEPERAVVVADLIDWVKAHNWIGFNL